MPTVVITGSSKGLGFEMAKKFLEKGWKVVINGSHEGRLEKATAELTKLSSSKQVLGIVGDVSKLDDMKQLGLKALEHFGSVDIWINNAGVNQPMKPIWEIPEETTKTLMEVDLLGAINGSQAAFALMEPQHRGAIYNVEGMGSDGGMIKGLGLYGTTKRAVSYFTSAFAKEAEDSGILIGRLSPGIMLTDFTQNALGGKEKITLSEKTRSFYRMVGDTPEAVAAFLVDGMCRNKKNDVQLVWLTSRKVFFRMAFGWLLKRNQEWGE